MIRSASATSDEEADRLEREAAQLIGAIRPAATLTIDFLDKAGRDRAKALLAAAARSAGKKGGDVLLDILIQKGSAT